LKSKGFGILTEKCQNNGTFIFIFCHSSCSLEIHIVEAIGLRFSWRGNRLSGRKCKVKKGVIFTGESPLTSTPENKKDAGNAEIRAFWATEVLPSGRRRWDARP